MRSFAARCLTTLSPATSDRRISRQSQSPQPSPSNSPASESSSPVFVAAEDQALRRGTFWRSSFYPLASWAWRVAAAPQPLTRPTQSASLPPASALSHLLNPRRFSCPSVTNNHRGLRSFHRTQPSEI